MPPMPQEQQRAACVLGFERFEVFAAQIAMRVRLGTPLMTETIDRLDPATSRMVPLRLDDGALLTRPLSGSDHKVASSTTRGVRSAFPAAAREDGSNGRFPETRRTSAQ
jgi:hypothetical protein